MFNVKLTLVVLIFGFVASIALDTPADQEKCDTPGKTFFDGCNTCWCSEDGVVTACTYKLCPSSPILKAVVADEVPKETATVPVAATKAVPL